MQQVVIGIDPGQSGGLALVGDRLVIACKIPETETDVWLLLHDWISIYDTECVYIEAVHSMPKQGVASSFKFGMNYGFYRGLLTALPVRWKTVSPQAWQKAMQCRTHGDKNISKAASQRLFPSIKKITHATADALLIAKYGWDQERVAQVKP